MGTRATYGFYYKGKYYMVWIQYDGYLNGLGIILITEIRAAIADGSFETWKDKLMELKIVTRESAPPTDEEYDKLRPYHHNLIDSDSIRIGGGNSNKNWTAVLDKCTYSYIKLFESGYLFDCQLEESMDCDNKYVYILDLDRNVFRYKGRGWENEFDVYNIPSVLKDFGEEAEDNV